jgi:hypothetical protein
MDTGDLLDMATELTDVETRREQLQIFCAIVAARGHDVAPNALFAERHTLWDLAKLLHEATRD